MARCPVIGCGEDVSKSCPFKAPWCPQAKAEAERPPMTGIDIYEVVLVTIGLALILWAVLR